MWKVKNSLTEMIPCDLCTNEATSLGYYKLCPVHSAMLRQLRKANEVREIILPKFRGLFKKKGVHLEG